MYVYIIFQISNVPKFLGSKNLSEQTECLLQEEYLADPHHHQQPSLMDVTLPAPSEGQIQCPLPPSCDQTA